MGENPIIELYTTLASNPDKDFGWDKGLQNARNHHYKEAWIEAIPDEIWRYCAAVGKPFEAGVINEGQSVLDLGCGAGVDLCVAALLVGKKGHVFGIDVTPAMVEKARLHANLAGLSNVTVGEGSFENLFVENESIDVVISNGAINLALSKESVFSEIFRVLRPGGHLAFSDMIKDESQPVDACSMNASSAYGASWANCVAGTLTSGELILMLSEAGFIGIKLLSTNHYKTSALTIGATFSARKGCNARKKETVEYF